MLSVVLLACAACDQRWDGKKTNGQVEEEQMTTITSAEVEAASAPPAFEPWAPPKYQDEKTLWRIGRSRGR